MKVCKKILGLFMCMLTIFISISDIVYALNKNVISGYKQVVEKGGTNSALNDDIVVSKTIEETNIENYFDITLKVNTTSKIEELVTQPDLAVVIVMDISNTMNTLVDGKNSRYESAMLAGESFINKFAEQSNGVNAKRLLGYVSFNTHAHETFALQEVKTSTKATSLISTMKSSTKSIIKGSGYASSNSRYTNIEGGLKRAWDMLEATDVQNKYIVLITDGMPTTYLNNTTSNKYDGYEPLTDNVTKSAEGVFANGVLKLPCYAGVDYSDRGAIKARKMATNIKNDNVDIMVVGTGIKTATTIDTFLSRHEGKDFSTVDSNTTEYEIGASNSTTSYTKWLTEKIASNNNYYDSDDSSLTTEYLKIFDNITKELEISTSATWVAEDPMGASGSVHNIEFVGLYDDNNVLQDSLDVSKTNQSDTANYLDNKISWDLKNSEYTTDVVNKVTHYLYEIKYRVRLENELSDFSIDEIYDTNGKTTLSYNVREKKEGDSVGTLSPTKYLDFPIPSVVGYLGEFSFNKISSFDNSNLSGAKFKLSHDPNCVCHNERKFATINDFIQISDNDGNVVFDRIPSGHSYILTEVEAPVDHNLSNTKEYKILVSYGEVTGVPGNNIVINELDKGNLEIQKQVVGDVTNPGEFEFILEVKYKDNKLSGIYNYKINDNVDGTIDLSNGIIKLNKDDKIVIYDLPVGATYSLRELTTDGFKVEYEINSNGIVIGETAICDNDCRINLGDTNKVKFINTASYTLPATGSSGMLILLIMGTMLLGLPVIYIGYSFYKKVRNIA